MRLCTVQSNELEPFFGVEIKNKVLRIFKAAQAFKMRPSQLAHLQTMMYYFQGWQHSEKILRKLLSSITENPEVILGAADDGYPYLIPQTELDYNRPIDQPGKILCIGLNYRDHCEEQNKPIPDYPLTFTKFSTSLNDPGGEIPLPLKVDECIDHEVELAVIIGKAAKKVRKGSAFSHVAGYTIMNDVSARTLQRTERQWARAKGFDGSAPLGPVVVTPDEIGDPHELELRCRVNGEIRQQSNTKHLVFKIDFLIQYLSQVMTLEPGDIISTGTPGGVGVYREPPVFLKPGDEVSCEISKIGKLVNVCSKG